MENREPLPHTWAKLADLISIEDMEGLTLDEALHGLSFSFDEDSCIRCGVSSCAAHTKTDEWPGIFLFYASSDVIDSRWGMPRSLKLCVGRTEVDDSNIIGRYDGIPIVQKNKCYDGEWFFNE